VGTVTLVKRDFFVAGWLALQTAEPNYRRSTVSGFGA
jgi:hypothetical protein